MNADQLLFKKQSIKHAVIRLRHQLSTIKDLGVNPGKDLDKFVVDFTIDIDALITTALIPADPRAAKTILEQIDKTGSLTPELLDEIRRLLIKPKS